MGPVVPPATLQRMQSALDSGNASLFSHEFKNTLPELSPQNRRAFARTMKLLSELLDASGSDGDRGLLIASFAEAIVLTGNPRDFVTLLDRLVEDFDLLFDEVLERGASSGSAASSLSRNRSYNKGSYSSTSSSLRKKFGFSVGLKRENSKTEFESKVSSLIRSWGKSGKDTQENLTSSATPSKVRTTPDNLSIYLIIQFTGPFLTGEWSLRNDMRNHKKNQS